MALASRGERVPHTEAYSSQVGMVKALIMPFSGPDPKAQSLLGFALYRPEARNRGVILGRKAKKPDICLCRARAQKPAQPGLQIGPSTGGGRFIW